MTTRSLSLLSMCWLAAPGAAWAALADTARIGVAGAVSGRVEAQAAKKGAVGRVVNSGKPLFLNDHVTTDKAGRLQVLLLDETVFTLGPNADMVLDEFVYDPAGGEGKVTARVTKGVFRFITGKIARKDPAQMKVKLPVGTIGIRGTEVVGEVSSEGSTVILGGPGAGNNAGEPAASADVNTGGGGVLLTRPGWGTTLTSDSAAPAPPTAMGDKLAAINGSLAPQGGSSKEEGAGSGGSSGQDSGQDTASGIDPAAMTGDTGGLQSALGEDQGFAQQTAAASQGALTWERIRAEIPSGSGSFGGTGSFTQTLCGGSPCSNSGTWNFSATVNFGLRSISGSAGITTAGSGSFTDSASISLSFASITGQPKFNCNSSFGTYTYELKNGADGHLAHQMVGDATYNSGSNIGSGVTITSTCSGCP